MYCKNCAAELAPNAVVCVHCGVPAGKGDYYCPNCAAQLPPGAAVCMTCGSGVQVVSAEAQKSKMAGGLLGIFLGAYGVHNFYLGYTTKAVIQLCLTVGGILFSWLGIGFLTIFAASIWGLIEGIMILAGSINVDGKGIPLKD